MCNYLPIGYNHVPTEVNWSFDIDITESKSHVFFKIYFSMSEFFFFFNSEDVFFCTAHLSLLKSRKELVMILKSTTGNIDALSTGKQSRALTEYACSILPIERFIALCWGYTCDTYLWNVEIYPSYHFFLSSVLTHKFGRPEGRRAPKKFGRA